MGRVILTETDRGAALLLDDRYHQPAYRRLCPEQWEIEFGTESGMRNAEWRMRTFWGPQDDRTT